MPPDLRLLTIKHIWLIPWIDEDVYGVACEYADGGTACHFIGTEFEAQVVVEEIRRQMRPVEPPQRGENVIDMLDATPLHRRGKA